MALSFLHKKILHNFTSLRFYCNLENKRDQIESLLQTYGLTADQISSLLIKNPSLPSCLPLPEKTLKPKLDFFKSVGLSPLDLIKILTRDPQFFNRGLENNIIPAYQHLKSILHTTENVNFSITRSTKVLRHTLQGKITQNIDALRECGVPRDSILNFLKTEPRTMISDSDKFSESVLKIKNMGFDPNMSDFLRGVSTLVVTGESDLEKRKEVCRKWGWSDEDILAAFKKVPLFMTTSDKKIDAVMDFLVNKMGFCSSEVGEYTFALMHSLEKWTVPRCLVYRFLLSKNLIEKKRLAYVISLNKPKFSKVFLDPYTAEFPELLTIYEPKTAVSRDMA